MPHSMTGFSTAEARVGSFRLVWEIRSVNHRFLELGFRLPEELRAVEPECRELVAARHQARQGRLHVEDQRRRAQRGRGHDRCRGARAIARRSRSAFAAFSAMRRPLTAHEVLRWPGVLEEPAQSVEELGEAVKSCLARGAARARRRRAAAKAGASREMLEKRNAGITALIAGIKPQLDGAAGALPRAACASACSGSTCRRSPSAWSRSSR